MNRLNCYLYLLLAALLAYSCSQDTDVPHDGKRPQGGVPVEFTIAVPQGNGDTYAIQAMQKSRAVPDPGVDTDEGEAWDSLLVVVAYTEKNFNDTESFEEHPEQTVYYELFRRSDFKQNKTVQTSDGALLTPILNADGTDSHYRRLTMMLPVGKMRIYGVTYASSQTKVFNPEDSVSVKRFPYDKTYHATDIERMLIPNSYGAVSYNGVTGYTGLSAFLSVATGMAEDNGKADAPYDLELTKDLGTGYMNEHWSMVLHRLATKIDIQWDAESGFSVGSGSRKLTDVKVEDFVYDGRATLPEGADARGYGRLFPWMETNANAKPMGGKWNFQNQTEISQRNGRVTHCFFPDGVRDTLQAPQVHFNITKDITENGTALPSQQATISIDMKAALKRSDYILPAAWYKLTMNIKGDDVQDKVVQMK